MSFYCRIGTNRIRVILTSQILKFKSAYHIDVGAITCVFYLSNYVCVLVLIYVQLTC